LKLAIIGTGYVGLVAGACFAETGNNVICVDKDEKRIGSLLNGEIPIFEPGLDVLVQRNVKNGRLTFTRDTVAAVKASDVIFLAVPTPQDENGSADLQHVLEAARQVAPAINGYKVIVDKSTVPVGTAAKVRQEIAALTTQPFDVVSNPEFLKEGDAVEDFLKPDRVVVGSDSERATGILKELYTPFVRTGNPIIAMRVESAELTKYAANSLLAAKISFMNEIALLCEKVGADVNEIRAGIGSDVRIGKHFLFPGLGFGGSCFPKDLQALLYTGQEYGVELKVINSTIEANRRQKQLIPEKIKAKFGSDLSNFRIAVWGIAFKANTDDTRESPALALIDSLLKAGAAISTYDPQAIEGARRQFGERIGYFEDAYDALEGADALVIATEWNEFRNPDFAKIKLLLKNPVIFDGRNLFNSKHLRSLGFEYHGVGNG